MAVLLEMTARQFMAYLDPHGEQLVTLDLLSSPFGVSVAPAGSFDPKAPKVEDFLEHLARSYEPQDLLTLRDVCEMACAFNLAGSKAALEVSSWLAYQLAQYDLEMAA